jgi:hypothetical protein
MVSIVIDEVRYPQSSDLPLAHDNNAWLCLRWSSACFGLSLTL